MLPCDQHLKLVVILGQRLRELHAQLLLPVSPKGHEQKVQRPRRHRFGLGEGGNQHGRCQFFGLSRGRCMKLVERRDDRRAREQVDLRRHDGMSFLKDLRNGMSFSTPSIIPGFSITSESSS